jgi:hypothetical protein
MINAVDEIGLVKAKAQLLIDLLHEFGNPYVKIEITMDAIKIFETQAIIPLDEIKVEV